VTDDPGVPIYTERDMMTAIEAERARADAPLEALREQNAALTDALADAEESPHLAKERARILSGARKLAFTLWRPGNGPAHGQEFGVVPLAELEKLIGGDGP
jgi:hypothetical protein